MIKAGGTYTYLHDKADKAGPAAQITMITPETIHFNLAQSHNGQPVQQICPEEYWVSRSEEWRFQPWTQS